MRYAAPTRRGAFPVTSLIVPRHAADKGVYLSGSLECRNRSDEVCVIVVKAIS
jgi:hypothetical protein